MKKLITNFTGFTLVELMVVVAIIGILATVAVPNFKRYQAKAKTSEAKLILASVYSAETAFMGEWDTYSTCLASMGISRPARGYYVFGFTTDNTGTNLVASQNGAVCADGGHQISPTLTVAVGGASAVAGDIKLAIVATNGDTFSAGAAGKISSDNTTRDLWLINENKILKNQTPGF